VLLTARGAPDAWGLKKRDLHSRLRLAPIVALGEPDEDLARAVLFKLFSDRQIAVDPAVIAYIALRIDRSLGAARRLSKRSTGSAGARQGRDPGDAALMLKDADGEGRAGDFRPRSLMEEGFPTPKNRHPRLGPSGAGAPV